MSKTQTSLLYGIIVKTWSLYIAVHAHPRIAPVALALDMIMRRVGNETLIRSDGVKVLPIEIWEMIRKEVHGIGIYDTEVEKLAFLNAETGRPHQYGNESCGSMDFQPRTAASSDASTVYDSRKMTMLCCKHHHFYEDLFDYLEESYPSIKDFLVLHHFSPTSVVRGFKDSLNDCVSSVAIDTQLDSGAPVFQSTRSHDEAAPASAALIPANLLATQFSTHRFKKFVSDYHLDLAPNGSVPSFTKRLVKKSSGMESDDGQKVHDKTRQDVHKVESAATENQRSVVEPGWMLWSISTKYYKSF